MIRQIALLTLLAGPAAAQAPAAPSNPAPANPAPVKPTTQQTLDRLFGMLKVAPDESSASAVEGAIQGQWLAEATPATKLLLMHGFKSLTDDHANEALDDFDAALDLQPDLAEGWHGRAMARAKVGDVNGAERDIEEVMKREPRQFAALQDLSRIAEQRGDWKGAYAAWSRAMELDPKTPGGADRLKDLKRRAFGDST